MNFFAQIINPEVMADQKLGGIKSETPGNQPNANLPFEFLGLLESIDKDLQVTSINNILDRAQGNPTLDNPALLFPQLPIGSASEIPETNPVANRVLTEIPINNEAVKLDLSVGKQPLISANNRSTVVPFNPAVKLISDQLPNELLGANDSKAPNSIPSGSLTLMSNPSFHLTKVPEISPLSKIVSRFETVNNMERMLVGPLQSEEKLMIDSENKSTRPILFRTNLTETIKGTSKADNKIPPPVINSLKIAEVAITDKAFVKTEKEIIEPVGNPQKIINSAIETRVDEKVMQGDLVRPTGSGLQSGTGDSAGNSRSDGGLFESGAGLAQKKMDTPAVRFGQNNSIVQNFESLPKSETSDVKTIQSPVRFSIVENINNQTIKTGRTITIKMEPEHLGHIRLTLTSQHHGIVGRMVVDSPAALTVIESNIENLHQELSSKGVRLDAFQVSVGGEQAGKKSTSGETNSPSRGRRVWSDNNKEIVGTGNISAGAISTGSYINAGGVNCLA